MGGWRDELEDYWRSNYQGTTNQKIVQDRQMWKQYVDTFAQPWNTIGHTGCTIIMPNMQLQTLNQSIFSYSFHSETVNTKL